MADQIIALLGRRELPTDGVEDYCGFLKRALATRGVEMRISRVEWDKHGWSKALAPFRHQGRDGGGSWIVVHYTAMAWSRRGFPVKILPLLATLRRSGVRFAVVFHESSRQPAGRRFRDKFRGACQDFVIRRAFRIAGKAIFTVPLEHVAWMPDDRAKAEYIPIGANLPERGSDRKPIATGGRKTVAVFCLSPAPNRILELADLSRAAECVGRVSRGTRFIIMGKGSEEARQQLESVFAEKGVDLMVLGRLPAAEIAERLASADVLLYVYGHVSQTRGSVLAGVACGLPIVGYAGATREPIHDAGIELVPYRDREALSAALVRVLSDDVLRAELRRKSRAAQESIFSWNCIAQKYIAALRLEPHASERTPQAQADRVLHSTD